MKKTFIISILIIFLIIPTAFSHPGRTAADGCHYCRTNCDSWGVPYNERHCHGGGDSSTSSSSTETPVPEEPSSVDSIKPEKILVTRVIDGDTIVLSNDERVRLIGIDTPETKECYFNEATKKLEDLVLYKEVRLEIDLEDRDKYDRLLRYVYIDDIFINVVLVEEGYAKAYPYNPDNRFTDLFDEYEKLAKKQELGLWGNCTVSQKQVEEIKETETKESQEEITGETVKEEVQEEPKEKEVEQEESIFIGRRILDWFLGLFRK